MKNILNKADEPTRRQFMQNAARAYLGVHLFPDARAEHRQRGGGRCCEGSESQARDLSLHGWRDEPSRHLRSEAEEKGCHGADGNHHRKRGGGDQRLPPENRAGHRQDVHHQFRQFHPGSARAGQLHHAHQLLAARHGQASRARLVGLETRWPPPSGSARFRGGQYLPGSDRWRFFRREIFRRSDRAPGSGTSGLEAFAGCLRREFLATSFPCGQAEPAVSTTAIRTRM